ITASASSEYGNGDWSAKQMLGQPDFFPSYGDNGRAWAPAYKDAGLQWVELGFAEGVYVDRVEIYETFNPGAILKVELVDITGDWHLIWEGKGGSAGVGARVFSVQNGIVTVPCDRVRITLDTDSVSGWNEIDAVSITGSRNSPWPQALGQSERVIQWASGAKASSQYRPDRWTPEHMIGKPDVYPKYGDYDQAWTASTANGGKEWVELFYDEAVYVKRIEVYETYNPGAIVKVEIIDQTGRSHVVWEDRAQAAPAESRIFAIDNIKVEMPARRVRLELQTDQVPGFNEIDAVCLIGARTVMQETGEVGSLDPEGGTEQDLADSLEQLIRSISTFSF
ncbi:MAG: hypothetical protein ACOYD6_04995, partial [Limnochordia bacterium]